MPSKQSKRWLFTLNNYTEDEHDAVRDYAQDCCNRDHRHSAPTPCVGFLCFGREHGEGGTPHLQGYLELRVKKSLAALKRLPGLTRGHFEIARGTSEENITYCSKSIDDGTEFFRVGDCISQGQRTDLLSIREALARGETPAAACGDDFTTFLRYHRGLEAYQRAIFSTPRKHLTSLVWIWGPTGSGKSRLANFEASTWGDGNYFSAGDKTGQWFDGYLGQKAAIFDDITPESRIRPDLFLNLIDRYPLLVPVKGGFVHWRPTIVYITSNYSPVEIYGTEPNWAAFVRRLEEPIGITIHLT